LLGGAALVVMSDVNAQAVACARLNSREVAGGDRMRVARSDVFDGLGAREKFDLIVFAQPFFGGKPVPRLGFTIGMLNDGSALTRFFRGLRSRLTPGGRAVLMRWPFAGPTNDPLRAARGAGWRASVVAELESVAGVQVGRFEVVEVDDGVS
jgi:hypothetical protein